VTVSDGNGKSDSTSLSVTIEDDAPIANADANSVTAGMVAHGAVAAMPAPVINGDVVDGGVAAGDVADMLGADGFTGISWQGEAGGTVAGGHGTLTVGTDGTYSYDLNDADLAVVALTSAQSLTDVFTYTITDGDGDSATTTLTITINGSNDGPTIADPAAVRVSEEGLADANPDTAGDLDTTNSDTDTSGAAATDPDGDTLAYTLGDPGAVLSSDGQPVSWSGAGTGTLVGSVGLTTIITITVDGSGNLLVDLDGPIDHPDITEEDDLTFSVPVTVSDGNGKSDSTSLSVTIEDDAPEVVTAASALLGNHQGGDAATEQLNFFENVGADRGSDADVVFVNNELDNKLRGSIDGDPAEVLTSGGHEILLTGFDSTMLQGFLDLNDNGVIDDGAGSLILQIDLDPDAGDESLDTYTVQLFGMIDNGEALAFDDFSGINGNNNVFFPLDSSNDPSAPQDLLITSTVPGTSTINTDSDDIGTGDQWLNNDDTPADGEIIRLDYVKNVTGDPDDISTLSYTQHYVVNNAGFRLNQLQSNDAISRSVLVRVYDEDDDPQGGAIDADPSVLGGDPAEQDDITTVRIERGADEYAFLADGTQEGITVTFNADGSVKIDGLFELDQVFVSTDDGFTQMEIQNVTSGGTNLGIALDNFLIGIQQSGDPIDLFFDLEVTDSDGDTNSGSLAVTLLPQLNGTSGNDTLESNGDAEILVGGLGNDTLTGGGEADIFVFNVGVDDGDDTITDFTGSEDILKFIDVVDGAGDDIQDVDDMITSIVNDGAGDVQVNLTNGGSIVFEDIAFAAQTSIADLVGNNSQVVVDHM
jgi:VCBS repeat-containing protein